MFIGWVVGMGERECVGGECGFTSSKASSALSSLVVMFAYVGGVGLNL